MKRATVTFRELLTITPYRWHMCGTALGWAGLVCRGVLLTVFVFEATGSALGIALTLSLTVMPAIVIGPIMGVIIDRSDRRRWLIGSYTVAGLLIGSMIRPLAMEQAMVVALGLGVCQAIINPAISGLLTQIVPTNFVAKAVSLGTTVAHGMRVVVPVCMGVIMLKYGLPAAFLLGAIVFMLAAVLLSRVVPTRSGVSAVISMQLADVWSGFGWVMRSRVVRMVVLLFVVGVCALDLPHLNTAVYLQEVLARPPAELGLILSLIGVGAMVGSLAAGKVRDEYRYGCFCLGMLVSCVVLVPVGFGVGYVMLCILWVVQGMGLGVLDVCAGTMVIQATPEEWRGRAISATNAMVTAVMVVWFLVAGSLTDRFGPAVMFGAVGGVCGLLVLIIAVNTIRPVSRVLGETEGDSQAAVPPQTQVMLQVPGGDRLEPGGEKA